ncbi:MAG: hypothetical protein A2X22_02350 [Bacteroidetes bacterium GWF2_49_14]|nr:MAG: hypothetical protein A2X22_02350 [Bacteroidetes bacterium GWF2_49_14]HBB90802.1 hypothetical protein [Bacteroidales bacterium]
MLKIGKCLSVITLAASLISCNLINPEEKIPALIKIDTVLVKVTNFDQGSASHKMTNIWISVGGKNLGVYETPTMIPCLETGPQWIYLRPGIKMNGIAGSRVAYPFFEPYELNEFILESGKTTVITPTTTYKKECKFPWMEDFEDAGVSFDYPSYSDSIFRNQSDSVKEGRFSGAIYLDKQHQYFEANSSTDFVLPGTGTMILLEFDYKSNTGLESGVYVITDGAAVWNSLVYIKPSATWNRIYIDLHSTVGYETNADAFRIGLRAEWDSTGLAKQGIIMDNLKLIHF